MPKRQTTLRQVDNHQIIHGVNTKQVDKHARPATLILHPTQAGSDHDG